MQAFFIAALERALGPLLLIGAALVIFATIATFYAKNDGGWLSALLVLGAGTTYLLLFGGLLSLGLGIYHNTRRMADAAEAERAARR
ncbi:MAG: hypothetical protein AAF919_13650 [Pseudomonadota bacterium]